MLILSCLKDAGKSSWNKGSLGQEHPGCRSQRHALVGEDGKDGAEYWYDSSWSAKLFYSWNSDGIRCLSVNHPDFPGGSIIDSKIKLKAHSILIAWIFLFLLISLQLVSTGCSEGNKDELIHSTEKDAYEITYEDFANKVKDHQIDLVTFFPAKQEILAVTQRNDQAYVLRYSSEDEARNGYPIRALVFEYNVPFKIDTSY